MKFRIISRLTGAVLCSRAMNQRSARPYSMAIEYGLADLWFIARLHKTAPVSREMILNFIAQHSLGLPKSY